MGHINGAHHNIFTSDIVHCLFCRDIYYSKTNLKIQKLTSQKSYIINLKKQSLPHINTKYCKRENLDVICSQQTKQRQTYFGLQEI